MRIAESVRGVRGEEVANAALPLMRASEHPQSGNVVGLPKGTKVPSVKEERTVQSEPRLRSYGTPQPRVYNFASPYDSSEIPTPSAEEPIERPWHQKFIDRFFSAPRPVDKVVSNTRLYVALLLFLLGFALVIAKLFSIQILNHDQFSQEAASQYKMQVPIPAIRGLIRDRNGVILASNTQVVLFAIDPKSVQHRDHLAQILSGTFGKPLKYYLDIMKDTSRQYVIIEKDIPIEIASKLDTVRDRGLRRSSESRRQYAFEERASHIIGFTSKDSRGLAGIELELNKELTGRNGYEVMQKDGHGANRPDVDYDRVAAVNGTDITLTIDEAIQAVAEAALKNGVRTAAAESGIAIVMNPKTGEILALANAPDFNPNQFGKATNEMLRDRAITDAYEPGSTIKAITAAAVLDEGVVNPDDRFDAEGGTWSIEGGAKIRDTHKYGLLTFRQALEKSSNVCFAKISDKLDRRRFYKYFRDFGLGNYTGIDLPGETRGYFRTPNRWGINSKRYMAFGYELTATPMQMAVAYSAIANMGVMMKPYLVAKRENANGTEITRPQELRRVINEKSARTLIDMMRGVVDSGTGTTARIKGVAIAGKTGTAQQLVAGHYSKEHYTSSFTGFFPAENPQYMISVVLRSPRNGYYGGAVSGPIFREIALQILAMNGNLPRDVKLAIAPRVSEEEENAVEIDGAGLQHPMETNGKEIPDVRGLYEELGRTSLESQGFVVMESKLPTAQESDYVIDRVEKVGGDTVRLVLMHIGHVEPREGGLHSGTTDSHSEHMIVRKTAPDFLDMQIAAAMKMGKEQGLRIKVSGHGRIKKQFPESGQLLDRDNPIVTLFGDE